MRARSQLSTLPLLLLAPVISTCSGGSELDPDAPLILREEGRILLAVPAGMSFHYEAEDVRLIEVRQGEFPPDGSGESLFLCDEGRPGPTFAAGSADERQDLSAALLNTWTRYSNEPVAGTIRQDPGLTYVLESPAGDRIARVDELIRPLELSAGTGFLRQFRIVPLRGPLTLHANVVNAAGEVLPTVAIVSGPPSDHDWSLATLGRSHLVVFGLDGGGYQCVVWSRPEGVTSDGERLRIDIDAEPVTFEIATVFTKEWSDTIQASILEELRE
jgi:hypothetical protein